MKFVFRIVVFLAITISAGCGGGSDNNNVQPPTTPTAENEWDQMNWDQGEWQ